MGDPVGAARYARSAVAADGTVLFVEPGRRRPGGGQPAPDRAGLLHGVDRALRARLAGPARRRRRSARCAGGERLTRGAHRGRLLPGPDRPAHRLQPGHRGPPLSGRRAGADRRPGDGQHLGPARAPARAGVPDAPGRAPPGRPGTGRRRRRAAPPTPRRPARAAARPGCAGWSTGAASSRSGRSSRSRPGSRAGPRRSGRCGRARSAGRRWRSRPGRWPRSSRASCQGAGVVRRRPAPGRRRRWPARRRRRRRTRAASSRPACRPPSSSSRAPSRSPA